MAQDSAVAPALRGVTATRYVTPLREGGSLPALVEADDDGLYVVKFRGAGQGPRALVAEVVVAELARTLGLAVPEVVLVELDPGLARAEPDPEIRDLIEASGGINVGLDYLPGALTFNPAARPAPDPATAAATVWLDALVLNVDRTPQNPNLLVWHGREWLIDHGAALYPHHGCEDWAREARRPFPAVRDHVLLPYAGSLLEADDRLAGRLGSAEIKRIAGLIPGTGWPAGPRRRDAPTSRSWATAWRRRATGRTRPRMPEGSPSPFQYAMIRVVPRIERGECLNAGVVLFCRPRRFLAARVELDEGRLAALAPGLSAGVVRPHLEAVARIAEGDPAGGPIAALSQSERFGWLVAPSSTIVQASAVHTGLCTDPEAMLAHLFARLVADP